MHVIKWSSEFALGIDEIDTQHMALVGMINALDVGAHGEGDQVNMRGLLDELKDYVADHFGFEERLMGGGGCSADLVARHFGEHAYFRSVLRDLTADFESGRTGITVALIEYLVHWLLHHIAVVDRAMADQLSATEPGLAARLAAARRHDTALYLTDAERQLIAELRRANKELEAQVSLHAGELQETNRRLQSALDATRAEVARLRGGIVERQ